MAYLQHVVVLCMLLASGPTLSAARSFKLVNNCKFTVWPGTLSNAGQPSLLKGGLVLPGGASHDVVAPAGWAGRWWGRSGCSFDSTGAGSCETGDCGRGLYCDGAGGIPPATLAEFTLDGYGSQDFYDVSLVDGYNLPLSIVQSGGAGACGNPGCTSDLNLNCPTELRTVVGNKVVACKSACEAFQEDRYCCSGAFNSPKVCTPTDYSQKFKQACPTAYSYAYDDQSSTFTCTGAVYTITFCPGGTSGDAGLAPLPSVGPEASPPAAPTPQYSSPTSPLLSPPSSQALPPSSVSLQPPPSPLTVAPQFSNPASSKSTPMLSVWLTYAITLAAVLAIPGCRSI